MKNKNLETIYSVNGRLQAALIESILGKAGIPTMLANSKNGAYLDICVPSENAVEAKSLLNCSFPVREMCVFPGIF